MPDLTPEGALTHTESCRRFSVIVAKRRDEFQHVCICGAAVRRDYAAKVREVVLDLRSSCGSGGRDGVAPCCVSTDDVLAALDALEG